MRKLAGKTVLVTGGSRGMGRASALALAKDGAQVLVHYSCGEQEAAAVVAEIRQAGGKAEKVAADLAQPDGPHQLAQHVRSIIGARLDVLVAGAGVSLATSIQETTVEDLDRLFAINVRAQFFLLQQLRPALCTGSSVVLLSSLVAHSSSGNFSAYAVTKGAIDTMVRYFANSLGEHGIRVNAVASGDVSSDISNVAADANSMPAAQAFDWTDQQPKDIGALVAFLASSEARWITGETVCIDNAPKRQNELPTNL